MANDDNQDEGLKWQVGVWDRISPIYLREIDNRFTGGIDGIMRRAGLQPGQQVLDLGTGTGSVAVKAALSVAPGGTVTAIDISPEMLDADPAGGDHRHRLRGLGSGSHSGHVQGHPRNRAPEGHAHRQHSLGLLEGVGHDGGSLRPGGRLVAAVWGGPEEADIVLLQQTAGSFAPKPPVPGVGPGALADPSEFLMGLERAGIRAGVETETTRFAFDDFSSAWDVLAGVTTAQLPPQRQEEAKVAVRAKMWPAGDGPRHFTNATKFIIGER